MADALIYTSEKTLKEDGDKANDVDKKSVEEKAEALKQTKEGDDKDAIQKAYDELSEVLQKVGAAMYQQPEGDATASEDKTDEANSDEPVEGEVVDEEEKK
jgi:molecular chaperone DnaK